MDEEIIRRASAIINGKAESHGYCSLALVNGDGYPVVTTISIAKSDGVNWLAFCTGTNAKSDIIARCNKACVCLNSDEYHIALVGTIEQLTDIETKKEMWYGGLSNHFSGYDDPRYCVLKFTAEQYSLFVDWQEAKGSLLNLGG